MGTYSHSQLKRYLLNKNSKVKSALEKISKNGQRIIFVVDNENNLLGSVSDGDIRKKLIKSTISLNSGISSVLNKKPIFFDIEDFQQSKIKEYKNNTYNIIPILKNGKLVDLFISKDNNKFINRNFSLMIMAGGLGSRLKPYTNIIPKPLMPYKNKSLLHNIIDQFSLLNIKDIFISVNYKKSLIKTAMESQKKQINYIEELKMLGTAGSLSYLLKKKINNNVIVINCDVIVNYEISDILKYHLISNNDVTIVTAKKKIHIPYGICLFNNSNELEVINEKPKLSYNYNIGFYIFKKNTFKEIKKNETLDMDTFLSRLIKKKYLIKGYSIDSSFWRDYGNLNQMRELIE